MVVESSADAIITTTLDGTILTWNAGAQRIYGYSAREALGANAAMLAAGPAEQEHQRQIRASIIGGESVEPFEALRRRKDGSHVEMSITASPILDADGAVGGVSTCARDITERKRAERELARSRDLLQQAEAIAQMGSWEWNLATDHVTWSAGAHEILKLKLEDVRATGDAEATLESRLASTVHVEDRRVLREALQRAVAELTPVSMQLRAIRADGRVRVREWHADPIVDENGKPVRVIGVVRDITETSHTPRAVGSPRPRVLVKRLKRSLGLPHGRFTDRRYAR